MERPLVFRGVLATTTLALVAEGVVNVNLMPYAAGLGLPAAGLGLVFTAHRLMRLGATPWIGLAADRFGRRPPLLLGLGCSSLALATIAFADGFLPLLAARLLYGLSSALMITAGLAIVLDLAGPGERGTALGLYQGAIYGVYPLGSVAGGFLVDALGYRTTFLAASGAVLGSALAALAIVPETRRVRTGGAERSATARLSDYPRLLRGRVRRYIALKMLSGFAIWGVFEATFVLFLLEHFGARATLFGVEMGTRSFAGLLLGTLLVLGFLVGSPVIGRWSDRSGRRVPLALASLVVTVVGLLELSWAARAETIAAGVVLLGLAVALATAPLTALVGEAAAPEARATVMAAYSAMSDLASSAGAILGATVALSFGYQRTYLAAAGLVAVGTAALATGVRPAGLARVRADG